MPRVAITTFTDPACPFAWSAEPIRFRLRWRYGDQLHWGLRVVGLSKDGSSYERRGYTPEAAAASLRRFDRFGQPLAQVSSRPVGGTWAACRAIVATREHVDVATAIRLLRRLHAGALVGAGALDDPALVARAATEVGLDPADVERWVAEPAIEEAFQADLHDARSPGDAALALDDKLAPSGDDATGENARRYTCPSYVAVADGRTLEAPGFHTALTVETLVANLAPDLELRPWAEDPIEVLRWADEPMTTQEVAVVLDLEDDRDEARRRLEAGGATEHAMGSDAFWTVPA